MLLQLFYVDISASIVFFNFGLELDEVKLIFKLFNTIHQLRGDRFLEYSITEKLTGKRIQVT